MSITKQVFIRNQKALISSSNKLEAGFIVVFFALLLANFPLVKFINLQRTIWLEFLWFVGFFGLLIGIVPLLRWFRKRQQKRFGVECPNCGVPLVDVSAQIVIATSNCGHCGVRILDDSHDD
jgi:DNA-directed RNA polymerase subunit RPC12/RpoP